MDREPPSNNTGSPVSRDPRIGLAKGFVALIGSLIRSTQTMWKSRRPGHTHLRVLLPDGEPGVRRQDSLYPSLVQQGGEHSGSQPNRGEGGTTPSTLMTKTNQTRKIPHHHLDTSKTTDSNCNKRKSFHPSSNPLLGLLPRLSEWKFLSTPYTYAPLVRFFH